MALFNFTVLAGFIVLCIFAWDRHMDDLMVDTDLNAQQAIVQALNDSDGLTPAQKFRLHQAAVLRDLWQVSEDEVAKRVDLFHRH